MKSKKILHIKDCYFNLPDDFNGTLGEALILMSNRAIQAEVYKEMYNSVCFDTYDYLVNSDRSKCVMQYEFIDAD